jgi:phage-related protein
VTERGDFPVIEFIAALNDKEFVKCMASMEALLEYGNRLPAAYVKFLGDGPWELRPEFGGAEFRYFNFTIQNDTIVVLHAIKKKSEKDLEVARRRKKEIEP